MLAYSLCFLVIHRSLQSLTLVSGNNPKRIPNCSLIHTFKKTDKTRDEKKEFSNYQAIALNTKL